MQLQLRNLLRHGRDVRDLHGSAAARPAEPHVHFKLSDGLVPERHLVWPVPHQQVRSQLPLLCMRHRWRLRPGHHRHRCVHVPDGVHAGFGRGGVQRLCVRLLPQQRPVCCLSWWLQRLHYQRHLSAMQRGAAAPARRDLVWSLVPCWLLLERNRLQRLPVYLRDVCWGGRLHLLHGGLGDSALERHELRRGLPSGHLPVRHPVPPLQQ